MFEEMWSVKAWPLQHFKSAQMFSGRGKETEIRNTVYKRAAAGLETPTPDPEILPRHAHHVTWCHLMSLAHLAEVENMYSLKTQKARQFISEAQMAKSKHFQLFWGLGFPDVALFSRCRSASPCCPSLCALLRMSRHLIELLAQPGIESLILFQEYLIYTIYIYISVYIYILICTCSIYLYCSN